MLGWGSWGRAVRWWNLGACGRAGGLGAVGRDGLSVGGGLEWALGHTRGRNIQRSGHEGDHGHDLGLG